MVKVDREIECDDVLIERIDEDGFQIHEIIILRFFFIGSYCSNGRKSQ